MTRAIDPADSSIACRRRDSKHSQLSAKVFEVHPEQLGSLPDLVALLPQPLVLCREHVLLLLQLFLELRQLSTTRTKGGGVKGKEGEIPKHTFEKAEDMR